MVPTLFDAALTSREFEILVAMADGLTNDGIASRLTLGRKTVEAAVGSIFRKLDLQETTFENRRVLAVKAFLSLSSPMSGLLPCPSSSFVGRMSELVELEDKIVQHRFVSVVGAGGMGKTRLAIELGARRVERGLAVRFVDLAATGESGVLEAVFEAFGLLLSRVGAGLRPLQRVLRSEPSLVVFDNAEHVLDRVGAIVSQLSTMPEVQILVTSRAPLNVDGEFVWRIPSMNPPEARQLLIDRTAGTAFSHDCPADDAFLDLWSERLDGMPLAIELVAHRLASLPVQSVSASRDRLPDLLQRPGRGRHANLRSIFDSSVCALDDDARYLFARLSVFVGGFTLDAVSTSFGADLGRDMELVMERLVQASLVSFVPPRYRMLEPIRQYANELLVHDGAQTAAESQLIQWCVGFTEPSYRGFAIDPVRWRPLLTSESGNIDAALGAALKCGNVPDALRIVGTLWNFWSTGHASKGWDRVMDVLASLNGTEDEADRARVILGAGWLAHHLRKADEARTFLTTSVRIFEAIQDDESLAIALHLLAQQHDEPERFDRAIELAHAIPNPFIESWAYAMKGEWLMRQRRGWATALACFDQAERISRSSNHSASLAGTLRAKAHSMLAANWLGETNHSWEDVDIIGAECEQIVRTAPGAWQLADIVSVRCRNDLQNGHIASAQARTLLLLDQAQRTDDPSEISEAVLIAATTLATMGDAEIARHLVASAGPVFHDHVGPFMVALTLEPRSELYTNVSQHLAEPRVDHISLLALADRASGHLQRSQTTT